MVLNSVNTLHISFYHFPSPPPPQKKSLCGYLTHCVTYLKKSKSPWNAVNALDFKKRFSDLAFLESLIFPKFTLEAKFIYLKYIKKYSDSCLSLPNIAEEYLCLWFISAHALWRVNIPPILFHTCHWCLSWHARY